MAEEVATLMSLAEERLRLEREAFELERSRLESARDRAEAELKLARSGHPFLVFSSVALLSLVAFAGGMLCGISVSENRQQQYREARLREALSQLGGFAGSLPQTNSVSSASGMKTRVSGAKGDVAVVVIQ